MRVQDPRQEDPPAGDVRRVLIGRCHGVKRGETLSNVSNIKSHFVPSCSYVIYVWRWKFRVGVFNEFFIKKAPSNLNNYICQDNRVYLFKNNNIDAYITLIINEDIH